MSDARPRKPSAGNTADSIRIHSDISEGIQDLYHTERKEGEIDAPTKTLSPISTSAMNTLYHSSPTSTSKPVNQLIRSVSAHHELETSAEEATRAQTRSDPMPPSSSKHSSPIPTNTYSAGPPLTRRPSIPLSNGIGIVRTISTELGPSRVFSISPQPASSTVPDDTTTLSPAISNNTSAPQWSSAVGRANLGKSGRVIERLMGENDMLKRDLKLKNLQAEEARQAVKMAEGRMEAQMSEYEGRLHEAAINKALLKRRERQLADLKAQVEGERVKREEAERREEEWRECAEGVKWECKMKVEEAQGYAALMEGRNKTMTSHWKEQGAEVERTVGKLGKEIDGLVEERRQDDTRMNMLQSLCEQQKEELGRLRVEKDGIGMAFERYKMEQEEQLKDIRSNARRTERENEKMLEESRKVLGDLKWALGVQKNIRS